MNKWTERELQLNQRHEQLLLRRKALLEGTEAYFDICDKKPSSFVADISKSMARNNKLREELFLFLKQHTVSSSSDQPKFNILKNNYWAMVRSVFPLWYEEVCDVEKKKCHSMTDRSLPRT